MAIEIERKFLVRNDDWRKLVTKTKQIHQGYLASDDRLSVRVRTVDDQRALLTIKSSKAALSRSEFEYPIPLDDAAQLLAQCQGHPIEKIRHVVPWHGLEWEIDLFSGANDGLVVAEIELQSVDQQVELPGWIGEEVTGQDRYSNNGLSVHPFTLWSAGQTGPES
ncbi:MAG: CYTH domain-containing protein [Hyphomicrobiales bacterium]|nr:CYTH domain-containing protein [Hyphomicrobiales bacterium]